MTTILCYGDSNTYGYNPVNGLRYPKDVRWTGVLQKMLGEEYVVIEEGCNGSWLTASLLTPSWRKSRNRRGSVIQKISATRLLTSYCAPERITADAIRTGPAMKNCARLSRRKCSPIPRSCCRLSRLTPKRQPTSRRNTTTLSTV